MCVRVCVYVYVYVALQIKGHMANAILEGLAKMCGCGCVGVDVWVWSCR